MATDTGIINIDSFVESIGDYKIIDLPGAPFFNGFSEEHRNNIIRLYRARVKDGDIVFGRGDEARFANIEETAKLYHAQNLAFEDILTKQGFEPVTEVLRDYEGRIAFLSLYSTLCILGKPKEKGRHITMIRAHDIMRDHNNQRCWISKDLRLGERVYLDIFYPIAYKSDYNGSSLRGLAINPQGADGDELETHTGILTSIDRKTRIFYRELQEQNL